MGDFFPLPILGRSLAASTLISPPPLPPSAPAAQATPKCHKTISGPILPAEREMKKGEGKIMA